MDVVTLPRAALLRFLDDHPASGAFKREWVEMHEIVDHHDPRLDNDEYRIAYDAANERMEHGL